MEGKQHSPEPVVKQIHAERAWVFPLAEGLDPNRQGWSRQTGPCMKLLARSTWEAETLSVSFKGRRLHRKPAGAPPIGAPPTGGRHRLALRGPAAGHCLLPPQRLG